MKAKDLMIGDLVFWDLVTHKVDFDGDVITNRGYGVSRRIIEISSINEGGVTFKSLKDGSQIFIKEEELTPIPLTSDILMINRFENIPYAGIDCDKIWLLHELSYYGEKFPLHIDDIMLRYDTLEQCWRIFFNIGDVHSDFRTVTNIFYVHELQHALKLCRIEKDIIL